VAGAATSAATKGGTGTRTASAGGTQTGRSGGGWPVVPPPDLDLPPRPAPRAPLSDVVPKRTLVAVAVVVVLAVIGTVLALTLDGGDDEGGDKGAAPTAAVASAGATTEDKAGGSHPDGRAGTPATATGDAQGFTAAASSAAAPDQESDEEASDGDAEDGVRTHRGAQGYSIGLPEGWSYAESDSAGDRFTGPRGQKLLVAWTSTPKDDPVADWKNQERYMVRKQYHRIRIEKTDYRGWNTADWEFTYVDGGTEYRTVDRGFVVDDHQGYALMYTARADDWDDDLRRETWRTLTESFRPKGAGK
jgi:hypothetical protein